MLTLFVVPSRKDNASLEKTADSFCRIKGGCNVVPVSSWRDVNECNNKDEWFGVVWDNEYIDDHLIDALPIYFLYQRLEALILYKKVSMVEAIWRYRFFKRSVYLKEDFAPHHFWINKEIVLDGWVLEHEHTP